MTDHTATDRHEADRRAFDRHVAHTSPFANGLQIASAEGCWITDVEGSRYLDFIAGIAVCNVGHCHPAVVQAVRRQAGLYAHTMVYGEHVQAPQVRLATEIAAVAPPGLDCVYFMTTGAEANDAALKMAAKLTGRRKLLAFRKAYHGDTFGAAAVFGDEAFRAGYAHVLHPTVEWARHGSFDDLEMIDAATACVLVEPVQGEAGIRVPPPGWLAALRARCTEVGAMLVFDEVQTGFGRLGSWFAAGHYGVTPDAITMAKGMGMGLPLAGLLAPRDMLWRFAAEPAFSHITTFGGHPVSCAAALAGMEAIRDGELLCNARVRGRWLKEALSGPDFRVVREVRGEGLMIGVEFDDDATARRVVEGCKARGMIVETNLMAEHVVRLSPPLNVTADECGLAMATLGKAVSEAVEGC